MTELKKTPLYAAHCARAARMVDFGGWAMPLHYGSQLDEHRAVRTDAGMFDVSHMCVIDLHDADGLGRGRAFLRVALANNVDKLKLSGRALYTCMLNPEGGVRDDLIVYFFNDDFFRLVVNAATAEKDIAWLNQLSTEGGFGLAIVPRRDLAIIAAQGPNARAKVWRALPAVRAASETLKPFSFAVVRTSSYSPLPTNRSERVSGKKGLPERCPRDPRSGIGSLRQATSREQPVGNAPTPGSPPSRSDGACSTLRGAAQEPECIQIHEDFEHRPTQHDARAVDLWAGGEIMLARTGYTGEEGFELIVTALTAEPLWTALCDVGVHPCGLGARDTLRLEAGMNLYGQDMDEHTSPLDSGLGWSVDLQSAHDFIGKVALMRDGCRAAFVGLVLCDSGGILRAHQTVLTPYGHGAITSGTFSPTMHRSIGFARVPRDVSVGEIVSVQIRDKICAARVVKLPFVRHGKILCTSEESE